MNYSLKISSEQIDYPLAYKEMTAYLDLLAGGSVLPLVWLLEHKPVYTAGVSARDYDLLDARIPVYKSSRGGKYTYHGPGQRICYLMLNLNILHKNNPDVRRYVADLEEVIIQTLAYFGVKGERRDGRIGVWVVNPANKKEEKIAAIGVKFKKYCTMHGFAININPNLDDFKGIVPCGISDYGVCSLESLGIKVSKEEVDKIILEKINQILFNS